MEGRFTVSHQNRFHLRPVLSTSITIFQTMHNTPTFNVCSAIDGFQIQLTVLLPEGKRAIKRQLCSEPFTLREAASFIFQY